MTGFPGADQTDGTGQPAKNTLITRSEGLIGGGPQTWITSHTEITYYLRSTVLGGYVVGELNNLGQKSKQYVYAGGERLLEHWTILGYESINWQHRNPLTDSWIAVDPNDTFSFRSEVDAHGRETGIEAPMILPNDPPPPPTRDPSYLEMHGAPTIEAELGMQLYEDVYINRIFEDGNGPGQGGYDRLRTIREFQLGLGGKFALGMSWFDVVNNRQNYESVVDYVKPGWERRESGLQVNYYRLKPGTGPRGKAGPSEKEQPQDPSAGTTGSDPQRNDCTNMADRAEHIANDVINSANAWKGTGPAALLQRFNRIFATEFAGTYAAEGVLGMLDMPMSSSSQQTRANFGQRGFPQRFRDEQYPEDDADQTHHFAAYFSAGMANQRLFPNVHRLFDGSGDANLGRQAQLLGRYLRKNPGQLPNVGKLIRDTICNGGAVPK